MQWPRRCGRRAGGDAASHHRSDRRRRRLSRRADEGPWRSAPTGRRRRGSAASPRPTRSSTWAAEPRVHLGRVLRALRDTFRAVDAAAAGASLRRVVPQGPARSGVRRSSRREPGRGSQRWALAPVVRARAAPRGRRRRVWPRAFVYLAGARVCHQRPERSFRIGTTPLPVCARCTGLYVGAVLGLALVRARHRGLVRRRDRSSARWLVVTAAAVPTVVSVGERVDGRLGSPMWTPGRCGAATRRGGRAWWLGRGCARRPRGRQPTRPRTREVPLLHYREARPAWPRRVRST